MALFIAIILSLTLYLIPSIIAAKRKHHNIGSIITLNIFLGWTFIGWVIALSMASSAVKKVESNE